ncbi:citrate synthase family protein [Roseateles oligotrophus]|uniref:citrate synthase (unknown stereospecificity) n=1 Tax=Roseateles oligotrophus TaxID=1769250 RepID=A0ABT2YI41_9BURK|nr:citrate synthase family protein [Roseateles oligotrophus]MCV2369742.1 citrate synthase family protein [Roseateles oligotrophus]
MKSDISATEAAAILGVSLATLYSYVSRGFLQSSEADGASRSKRYSREAVLHLAARKADGKRGGHRVAAAMHWGVPVLETRISGINDGQLHYRGHKAVSLAQAASLEQVAALLWGPSEQEDPFELALPAFQTPQADGRYWRVSVAGLDPLRRAQAYLPLLAQQNPSQQSPQTLQSAGLPVDEQFRRSGAQLMRLLAALLLNTEPSSQPLHRQLAQAWGLTGRGADLIRAALVLLADHELNASTFSVRCVASTDAELPLVLSAGLAALAGPAHGGGCALAREIITAALSGDAVQAGLEGAGFGHPLYPAGDPRAQYLLARLAQRDQEATAASTDALRWARVAEVTQALGQGAGLTPNADAALAAIELALALPPGSGLVMFALGRSAGWIAHAIEQRNEGQMIRPRARYLGPQLSETAAS